MQSNVKPINVTFKSYEGNIYKIISNHPCQSAYIKECVLIREKLESENIELKYKLSLYENCNSIVNTTKQNNNNCCDIGGF